MRLSFQTIWSLYQTTIALGVRCGLEETTKILSVAMCSTSIVLLLWF